MSKTSTISLRVSVEQLDLLKSMGVRQSEIWDIGFDKWASSYPDYLQEKAQEYKKLYIQCIDKQGKLYTMYIQKNGFLDELYAIYMQQGRDIQAPSVEDRSWLKSRLGNLDNGNRVSMEQFFEYARKRFHDERQKRLEVEHEAV